MLYVEKFECIKDGREIVLRTLKRCQDEEDEIDVKRIPRNVTWDHIVFAKLCQQGLYLTLQALQAIANYEINLHNNFDVWVLFEVASEFSDKNDNIQTPIGMENSNDIHGNLMSIDDILAHLKSKTTNSNVIEDNQYDQRKPLPIDAHKDEIMTTVEKNRVTIIHGETGCGK